MGEYDDFLERMRSFDMGFDMSSRTEAVEHSGIRTFDATTGEWIQHHGVKGQKWGVVKRAKARVGETMDSMDRERGVSDAYNKRSKMSDDELKGYLTRTKNEVSIKRNMKTREDKKAYRNRGKMTDDEVKHLASRLNLENDLNNQIKAINDMNKKKVLNVLSIAGKIPMTAVPYGPQITTGLNLANIAVKKM